MKFDEKYELLDAVPGESGKSFQARQIPSRREVTVHLLTGGETPENQALLARLRKLPLEALGKVIEVGDRDGGKFVVTAAPPYLHLHEWLVEQERFVQSLHDQQFNRAGAWKVPPGLAGQTPAAPAFPAKDPDEFTKMFQSPAASPTGRMPVPPPTP